MKQPQYALRHVYSVLSARSLPYARHCLASLLRNAIEPLSITLITDEAEDRVLLQEAMTSVDNPLQHDWCILIKEDVDRIAEQRLAEYPAVRAFRNGHPCWRKITDPALMAGSGEEVIILDPDVYFPNQFCFEPTPKTGIYLMWQRPNCLLPEATVRSAFGQGISMADHTDIGVAQFSDSLDWGHLDTLIERLGGADLPRSMHVESIVWAELAVTMGGEHLNAEAWRCFDNSVLTRIRAKLGRPGYATIAALDIKNMKCLHGGGVAKNWFPEAEQRGLLDTRARLEKPAAGRPYVQFLRSKFEQKFALRRKAAQLGLYRIIGGG